MSDWYDKRMNYANPVLICNEDEEFRILIRDMLTKNGYFYVLEAMNSQESLHYLKENPECFLLLEAKILDPSLLQELVDKKKYIVFVHNTDIKTPLLSARLGIEHLMSYPFHSNKLIEKINSLA